MKNTEYQIRLIGYGIVTLKIAKKIAKKNNCSLGEHSMNAEPPVYKLVIKEQK